jgi:DNA repair protein RadC
MYRAFLYPQVTRVFRPHGNRYLCQFREHSKDHFTTDCAFGDADQAMSYVGLVVRFLDTVAEGKVLDSKAKTLIFACQTLSPIEPLRVKRLREATADYNQLVIDGFDAQLALKNNAREKRKVDVTLSKLRQLHEELNSQLYANPTERPSIHSPGDAFNLLQCFMGFLDHEELWVINMDTRNRVMRLVKLYMGSVNQSQVRVSEVFRQAIIDNAPSIILAHNHPSNDPTPSPEDVAVTTCIIQAGKLLDISVLDHIIVTSVRYVSMKERGLAFS